MLVVRKIENVPTAPNHKPKIPVIFFSNFFLILNRILNFKFFEFKKKSDFR